MTVITSFLDVPTANFENTAFGFSARTMESQPNSSDKALVIYPRNGVLHLTCLDLVFAFRRLGIH